jgi:hypothetical protein
VQNCQFEAPYYCVYSQYGQIVTWLSFENKFLMKSCFAIGTKDEQRRLEWIQQLQLQNVFEDTSEWPWHLSAKINEEAH